MKDRKTIYKLVLSAMFLALAIVLPFFTGQIKEIGQMLSPMHFPVILCGFFVGPLYGLIIGFVAPLIRFSLFGMPVIIPSGIAMSFELATYGFVSGYLFRKLKRSTINTYVSLIIAMILGRLIWALIRIVLFGLTGSEFGVKMFIAGAFTSAIPGIILQIIFIPLIVNSLKKYIR